MAVAKTIRRRKRVTRLVLVSLLFPLLHFSFPFLHQALKYIRYSEDFYLLYPYLKSMLLLLQLILSVTGLVSAFKIYSAKDSYTSPRLAVLSCLLRIYPLLYLLLMLVFVELAAALSLG